MSCDDALRWVSGLIFTRRNLSGLSRHTFVSFVEMAIPSPSGQFLFASNTTSLASHLLQFNVLLELRVISVFPRKTQQMSVTRSLVSSCFFVRNGSVCACACWGLLRCPNVHSHKSKIVRTPLPPLFLEQVTIENSS